MASTVTSESNVDPKLSNEENPTLSLEDRSGSDHGMAQKYRLNQLELEHAYFAEQNAHLVKELSYARYTINALRNITTQKETLLDATRQELDRAYFRIRMLSMTLARQEQRLQGQQQQQQQQQSWHYASSDEEAQAEDKTHATADGNDDAHTSAAADSGLRIGPFLQHRHRQKQQQQQRQQQSGSTVYNDEPQQLTPPESPRSLSDDIQQACHIVSDDDEEQVRGDLLQLV